MSQIGTLKLVDSSGSTIEVAIHEPADFAGGEPLLRVQTDNGMGGIALKDLDMADTNYRVQTQNGTKALNTIVYDWLAFIDNDYGYYKWGQMKEDTTNIGYGPGYTDYPTATIRWDGNNGIWVIVESDNDNDFFIRGYNTEGTRVFSHEDTNAERMQYVNYDSMDIDNNGHASYFRQQDASSISNTTWDVVRISYDTNGNTSVDWTYSIDEYTTGYEIKCDDNQQTIVGTSGHTYRLDTDGSEVWHNSDHGAWSGVSVGGTGSIGEPWYVMTGNGRWLQYSDGADYGNIESRLDNWSSDTEMYRARFVPPDGAWLCHYADEFDDLVYFHYYDGSSDYETKVHNDVLGFNKPYVSGNDGGESRIMTDQYGNVWLMSSGNDSDENPIVVYDSTLSNVLYQTSYTINTYVAGLALKPGSYPAFTND